MENTKKNTNKATETKKTVITRETREKELKPIFESYAKSRGLKCEYIDKDGGLFRIALDMNNAPKDRIDIKVSSKGVTAWAGLNMTVTGLKNGMSGSHISNKEKRYNLTFDDAKKTFGETPKAKPKKETAKKEVATQRAV